MTSEPKILAILRIGILDSPIKGIIYLADFKGNKVGLCTCRGHQSPTFSASDETSVYHECREWFMNNYDGFVQVSKLEGREEQEELKRFHTLKGSFSAN